MNYRLSSDYIRVQALFLRGLLVFAFIVAAWFFGQSIAQGKNANTLLFISLSLFIIIISLKSTSLYLLIPFGFVLGYFVSLSGLSAQMLYIIDAIILSLFAVTMLKIAVKKNRLWLEPVLLIWILYVFFQLILNSERDLLSIQSFISYLLYPLFYLTVVNMDAKDLPESAEVKLRKLLIYFVAIQVPITIIQKYLFYSISPDLVGGTLGRAGTSYMAVLMAAAWSFVLAYVVINRRNGPKAWLLLAIPLLPLALGEVKAGFILAAGGAVVVLLANMLITKTSLRNMRLVIYALFPLLAGFFIYRYAPAIVSAEQGIGDYVISIFSSTEGVTNYLSGYHAETGAAGRLELVYFIDNYLGVSNSRFFGAGLGVLSSSAMLGVESFKSADLTNTLGHLTSFGKFYMEIGIMGTALLIMALISIGLRAIKLAKRTGDLYWKVFGSGFAGSTLIFIISGFYTAAWRHDAVALAYWLCGALVAREWERQQASEDAIPQKDAHAI